MYLDRPLGDFIRDTSSRTPTPGGGSVAALVGALGSALFAMVGNFTLDKKKFKSVEKEVKKILDEINFFTLRLSGLIEEDISAYQEYKRTVSLPKNTPEEKKAREEAMQLALKKASEIPLRMGEYCYKILKVATRLLVIGNPNLISDIGVGAILAQASLESAALNVQVNLPFIKDKNFVREKKHSIQYLMDSGREITDKILAEVKTKINS